MGDGWWLWSAVPCHRGWVVLVVVVYLRLLWKGFPLPSAEMHRGIIGAVAI